MRALVLVDLQEEWRQSGSDYFIGDLTGYIDSINTLIDHARALGDPVIFVRHVEDEGSAFQGIGARIFPELHREQSDPVVTKHRISAFYNTELEDLLTDVEHVVVAGILTNLCVRSMVHDAYDRDFEVTVVTDCCVAMDEETHRFTLKDLSLTRPEVSFLTLDDLRR